MIGVLRGVVRVRKTWRPSQVPNRRYAPKNQGDSRLQVENEKESITESLSNPPAPPRRIAQEWDVSPHYTTWKELRGIDEYDYRSVMCRLGKVVSYLVQGGTDVERLKRECGVSDEILREQYWPNTVEERRQENLRKASPYVQACLAKLNQITSQDDDLELLDVVSIHPSMPYGCTSGLMRYHMHFRAMPKSNTDPGHESSRLYCAVYIGWGEKEFHVVGCVRLENDCPGGSNVETLGECLDAARTNAKTLGELLKLPPEADYRELSQRARETSSNCLLATKDEHCPVFYHLTKGGADVERVKREFGVSDETFERYYFSTNLKKYFQENWRKASPYIQASFGKLNQISNQADDFELLHVPFVDDSMPYGLLRRHMHFWAMRKSMGDPGHESPGFYCAVVYVWDVKEKECHVVGCVLLKNDCPDGAGCCNAETLAKCLDAARSNAKTLGELNDLPPEVDYNELCKRASESSRKREEMRRAKGEQSEFDKCMAFFETVEEKGKDVFYSG